MATATVPEWVHMADVPPADEEPWQPEDPLAPARGCLLGTLLGLLCWAAIAVVVWRVVR